MKIAVIGGKGFIGSEFIKYALERGQQTAVIGSTVDAFSDEGRCQITEVLSECNAMIFLAAKRPIVDFSLDDYLYNIRLAGTYFDYARDCGITNIVVTSSRSVYSSSHIPWKEELNDCPLSLYGASKQAVDELALYYNTAYRMQIKSLRLAQVIGTGEKRFLLNTLMDNAIMGKEQKIYGTGCGRRQYIYIKDVCDVILHCVLTQADSSGIFNIGMDYNMSVLELTRLINEVFGNHAKIEQLRDKPEDKKQYLMDVTKAERMLCWKPKYDMRKAFADIRENC